MPATKRRIALDIVATDTHCGEGRTQCPHRNWFIPMRCDCFPNQSLLPDASLEYKRLPECIAAEKAEADGK